MLDIRKLRPIHPFPARMAASIPLERLARRHSPITVLDPMMGSGTTIFVARALGNNAIGFDTDPLALTIAKVWCGDLNPEKLRRAVEQVCRRAEKSWRSISLRTAYPTRADDETKSFVRYWFDGRNRKQLAALSALIEDVGDDCLREQLWCALSRLIVVKQVGASLAMDVSHSRPHRVYDLAPIQPVTQLPNSVEHLIRSKAGDEFNGSVRIHRADARSLPLPDKVVDLIMTSPPYLNAIDYLRGHKLSLVWMGKSVTEIRNLRSTNIGAEVGLEVSARVGSIAASSLTGRNVAPRLKNMMARYVKDMSEVISEAARVLKPNGEAVFVVGDCTIRGVSVRNSKAIMTLAEQAGLRVCNVSRRRIPPSRRYLPPPGRQPRGATLASRLRTEYIISVMKDWS
jgi:DNA modification methylase